MPLGDAAVAAGMEVVSPITDLVKDGADEITRTRDYIAERTSAVTPVAKGGTGADTAAQARTNLGAASATDYAATKATVDQATAGSTANRLAKWGSDGRMTTLEPTVASHVCSKNYADGKVSQAWANDRLAGGSQPIYNNHGRANPVVTSWVAAAFNSDGRIAIQPSAERFKQDIQARPYTLAQAATIGRLVVDYRLVAAVAEYGDLAPREVGIIAERLIDAGFPEFVVLDAEGHPLTIRYEQLVTVALSALADVDTQLALIRAHIGME